VRELRNVIDRAGGEQVMAAEMLGMSSRTFRYEDGLRTKYLRAKDSVCPGDSEGTRNDCHFVAQNPDS
jgi:hypothetical protein